MTMNNTTVTFPSFLPPHVAHHGDDSCLVRVKSGGGEGACQDRLDFLYIQYDSKRRIFTRNMCHIFYNGRNGCVLLVSWIVTHHRYPAETTAQQ